MPSGKFSASEASWHVKAIRRSIEERAQAPMKFARSVTDKLYGRNLSRSFTDAQFQQHIVDAYIAGSKGE